MREEIKAKADKLGQTYFPDECNVWARANIEAQFVSFACIEMAEWMQRKMIEKACQWITEHIDIPYEGRMIDGEPEVADYIEWAKERLKCAEEVAEAFRKAMEE